MINDKTILVFGGTGSLGYELVDRYVNNNKIIVYSRDECKHWKMRLDYNNNPNLSFIIGDIIDKHKVNETLMRYHANIIIIASAMKHIDQCEYNTDQCINTNLLGIKNILDSIENNKEKLKSHLETVLFISSDKACSPVNVYGMCKALSEMIVIEKSYYIKEFKFLNVRYGNVLNSRGSIVPLLHNIGNDINKDFFTLTNEHMTRFIMTLQQSVDLIEHAILYGETGDIVIPKLVSMKIKDLVEIFSEIYKKPIKIVGIKPGEKMLESLINITQSSRINVLNEYTHIKSHFTSTDSIDETILKDYNSKINPLTKCELENYLKQLKLI